MEVFPNPAYNQITLKTSSKASINYALYNSQGRIVLKGAFLGERTIELSALPEGIYFLKSNSGKVPLGTTKVMVSR